MRARAVVGAKMTREAWETVTRKLLDLVGAHLATGPRPRMTYETIERFITLAGRAWSDLEQIAASENPGVYPPPAPVDESGV